MTSIADEAVHLASHGVEDRYGQKHWVMVLRTVGDWPWLHRAAKLGRTYANVVKRLDQTPSGICHLCDAGMDAYPFEQIGSRKPRWLSTMYRTCPFDGIPFMARVPHCPSRLAQHYAFDVLHTVQLGIGRYLTGTMLALWSDREGGNIEERFDAITSKYKVFLQSDRTSDVCIKDHQRYDSVGVHFGVSSCRVVQRTAYNHCFGISSAFGRVYRHEW